MTAQSLFAVRNALLKFAIHCASLLLLYGLFLGAVSVRVGLNHRHDQGFWVPVLAGCLFIALIGWLYFRILFAAKRALRRSDTLYL